MDKVIDYPGTIPTETNFNNPPDADEKPTEAGVQKSEGEKGKSNNSSYKIVRVENWLNERYEMRYNILKSGIEYRKKGSDEEFKELDDKRALMMEAELERDGQRSVTKQLGLALASVQDFDPVEHYVKGLPKWDEKTDHIERLASFVRMPDERRPWWNLMLKKHLVRSLACALGRIPFNKQCIVLVSGQDDGKTTYLRFWCPPPWAEYYTEDIDFENKDGLIALARNLIINLDELRNLSRQDINKVKSFLTKDSIKARLPYGRRESKLKRRASFVGSTNNAEFLVDETGNVRWLVFEINGIDHDYGGPNGYTKQVDINLVYAQAYALLQSGYPYMLTRQEILASERNNKAHTKKSLEYELILKYFEVSTDPKDFMPASEIKEHLERLSRQKVGSVEMVGKALKQLEIERKPKKAMGQVLYGYWLKYTADGRDWSKPDEPEAANDENEDLPF